jgi:hypothetical protein
MVGFVKHGNLNRIEVQVSLAAQILQAPGGRNDNLDAIAESLNLAALGHSPKDGGHPEIHCGSQRLHHIGDLGRQLACWGKHEPYGATRTTSTTGQFTGEPGNHGDAKREGLP